ncbi:MAG: lysophospholipid acyltransferase family protein [Candidatus Bipolaricaulia bacterium]
MKRLKELMKDIVYFVVVELLRLIAKVLFRLRVRERGNIPEDGAILIARHRSYWDVPLLAVAVGGRRRVHFVARRSLLKENPLIGLFVRWYAIPIDRDNFRRSDYRNVLAAISSRKLVGIFPEGTTREVDLPRIGVARFAERTGQKILPVNIVPHGPYPPRYPFHFPRVEIRIGQPFQIDELSRELPPGLGRSERYERLSLMLMERIDRVEREG